MSMLLALLAATAAPQAHGWQTYTNLKYGFKACFPVDLLRPQGESDAGDGQIFAASDGAKLIVFGRNDADGRLSDAVTDEVRALGGDPRLATYQAAGKEWSVASGLTGGKVYYVKAVRSGRRTYFAEMLYPVHRKTTYDPVSAHVSRCFAPLRVVYR